jgi:hypothetical protein
MYFSHYSKRIFKLCKKMFVRIGHWEYWNSNIIYFPVSPYLVYLFVRARNCFFFNAANPGIQYGGFVMESKWKIHKDAPENFFPETILVNPNDDVERVAEIVKSSFEFPLIAKPDIGKKGRGVVLINDMPDLELYHASCPVNYLIQKKINYPLEAGIFYVRYPNTSRGMITGIVEKKYVKVTGDGHSTIEQLLLKNKRYMLQMEALEKIITPEELSIVLPPGQSHTLLEIGNHARGALFLDASYRITNELTTVIDKLCMQFQGFYFGRLDIRFESWEDLEKGARYSIIELNGSGSEPTHIYDPSHSIFYGWKEICRHWKHMQKISRQNHDNGIAYLTLRQTIQMAKDYFKINRLLKGFNPLILDKRNILSKSE